MTRRLRERMRRRRKAVLRVRIPAVGGGAPRAAAA